MRYFNFKCPCGYIYRPEEGYPKGKIPPGTLFDDLPEEWICPHCGYEKEYFVKMDE